MPQFKGVQLPLRSSSQSTITAGGEGPWKPLGLGKDTLFPELENLYWEGVRGDLENIIQTLKIWQNPEFSNVVVADEEDTFIHGFDTFIDQVTKGPREFAIRYGKIAAAASFSSDDDIEALIPAQENSRNNDRGRITTSQSPPTTQLFSRRSSKTGRRTMPAPS
jgi:hypothetical protein